MFVMDSSTGKNFRIRLSIPDVGKCNIYKIINGYPVSDFAA